MKFKVFSFLLLLGQFLWAQNIIAPELIQSNTTWSADTVFLNTDLNIEDGSLLEIEAGTVVMMNGLYEINVQGSIQAQGTVEDSIFFTISDTLGFADSSVVTGGWNGLNFVNTAESNDSSLFEYCVLEYGKAFGETDADVQGGVMYVSHFDKIRITHSHIRTNFSKTMGGGLYMEYCSAKVELSRFSNNKTYKKGGAIYMGKQSEGLIDRNIFKNNISYESFNVGNEIVISGAGAGVYITNEGLESIAPTVSNNLFTNNIGPSGILYDSTCKGKLFGNTIVNNLGYPIYIGHSLSKTQCINNTIANNNIYDSHNTGIHVVFLSGVLILNNLVWENLSINLSVDTTSVRYSDVIFDSIQYNLLGDNYMEGTTNIVEQDPLFFYPSPGIGLGYDGELYDWSLQDNSPAVNTGKLMSEEIYNLPEYDINFEDRVYGGRIDIGAYENQNVVWSNIEPLVYNFEIKVYPNPSKDFNLYIDESLLYSEIQIYNMMGQMAYSGTIDELRYQINTPNWEKGTFLYKIISKDQNTQTGKWVKI